MLRTIQYLQFSSVQFSRSVVSNSLWPHELQHARPACPSPTPGVHSNSHPLSRWCHPAISSSVVPFSSCPQSLPASVSFPMSQLFAWGGQSIGVSALASVLPKNTQDWSPLEWTGWISLQSKRLSRVFSNTTVQKHQYLKSFKKILFNIEWLQRAKQRAADGPDNLCESTFADSKNPESAIWSSRQCLPVLGSLLRCIPQSV